MFRFRLRPALTLEQLKNQVTDTHELVELGLHIWTEPYTDLVQEVSLEDAHQFLGGAEGTVLLALAPHAERTLDTEA